MTPQHAITTRISRSPLKLAGFLLRLGWAFLVLAGVWLAWVALFFLFVPFIVLARILRLNGTGTKVETRSSPGAARFRTDNASVTATQTSDARLIFDRRKDVSKLFGCNTRGVRYRWSLFVNRLETLRKEFAEPVALDFGTGSLRDSYELAKQGFRVISFDLDETTLRRYYDSYDWTTIKSSPKLLTGSLTNLLKSTEGGSVHLVLAFDVIEHLEDPGSYVRAFRELLHERGYLFTIVPNRRSLFERYFKHSLRKLRKRGITPAHGVPHLQFKSPREWEDFFRANGFSIIEHDMAIGFLVNDCWNGLLGLPLIMYVRPVLDMLAYVLGMNFNAIALEESVAPSWLMEGVNELDEVLKPKGKDRFGWNLIVAQRDPSGFSDTGI